MMATHKIVLSVAQLQLLCNVSRRGMDFSHRKLEFIMPGSFFIIIQLLLYDLMKTFAFLLEYKEVLSTNHRFGEFLIKHPWDGLTLSNNFSLKTEIQKELISKLQICSNM